MHFFKILFENSNRQTPIQKLNYIWYVLKSENRNMMEIVDFIMEQTLIYSSAMVILGIVILSYFWFKSYTNKKIRQILQAQLLLEEERRKKNQSNSLNEIKDINAGEESEVLPIRETFNLNDLRMKLPDQSTTKQKCKFCAKNGHNIEICQMRKRVLADIKLKEKCYKLKRENSTLQLKNFSVKNK